MKNKIAIVTGGSHGTHADPDDRPAAVFGGKNRLHFDLYTTDQKGEVQRLLGIGATRHPRTSKPDEDFVMLADPEGNFFCVVDASK